VKVSRVTRGRTILAVLAFALAAALPASADNGVAVKGTLVAASATSVTVKDAKGVSTTCQVRAKSPSLDGYSTGDTVQAICLRAHAKLVLAKIRHVAPVGGSDVQPVTFGGVVTALSDTSISLRDGDRDLTCAIDADSPSTDGVKVGVHVRVACVNGTLVKLAPVTVVPVGGDGKPAPPTPPAPPAPTHTTVGASGTVGAVSPTSLTVRTDSGDVTCTVGDGSPSLDGVHVGDRVKIGCLDGVLKTLARSDDAPPPPPAPIPAPAPTNTVTAGGMLSALSDTSLTVHSTEHGDLSCTLGPSSPRLGDFHLGDHVGIACVDGVLAKIVKLS
jgi:hypothetical protein